MLMPLHDSMPSFMNFRQVLDLLEFKTRHPNVLQAIHGALSTNLYALEHVHVVQICIMHINALKTQLMNKNVQANPEKSQNLTQHSCCSMLTRETF